MTMGRTTEYYRAAIAVYFVCIGLFCTISAEKISIIPEPKSHGEIGRTANVSCEVFPETANVTWVFNNKTISATEKILEKPKHNKDGDRIHTKLSTIVISNATAADAGSYTCQAVTADDKKELEVELDLYFPGKWITGSEKLVVNMTNTNVNAWCIFEVYNVTEVTWYKQGGDGKSNATSSAFARQISQRRINSSYVIPTQVENNGTYICEVTDRNSTIQGKVNLFVQAPPKVTINLSKGISTTQIYLNWTVYTYNADAVSYYIFLKESSGNGSFEMVRDRVENTTTSFVLEKLNKSTEYTIRLNAQTDFGSSESVNATVKTLDYDPVFKPNISINGFSATSVTIGWKKPDEKEAEFIHYYLLEARKKDENVTHTAYHSRDERNLPYMFDNLEPHCTYVFKVRACNYYTAITNGSDDKCGPWSDEMEAATSDGMPTEPTAVRADCSATFMNLTWGAPLKPNAEIKGYTMELTGNATFRDRFGKKKETTWGPMAKFTTNKTTVRIDDLQPNTHYTVRLSAMTRTRRRGVEATTHCHTQPAPPDHPPRPRWRKILQDDKYMFKMYLPRIAERNGLLCCYRVHMIRLPPNKSERSLTMPPSHIKVMDYETAHAQQDELVAYITDVFSNDNFPSDSELVMGDGSSHYNESEPTFLDDPEKPSSLPSCSACRRWRRMSPAPPAPAPAPPPDLDDDSEPGNDTDTTRTRRTTERDYSNDPTLKNRPQPVAQTSDKDAVKVTDGPLDTSANYTLFVELITRIEGDEPMYSEYMPVLRPAPTPIAPQPANVVEIALQATCAVAALVLLLMIIFCIRQTRRSRKMPPHAPLEMNSLQTAIRNMFGRRAHHAVVAPPDMVPIPKDELAAAYLERQADSDYGFQKEFELLQMLPECYPDRTTHASEARENQPKNRYPDIKAYDQTRVVLTQVEGVAGSDYINANFVMGYQERKRFICAQGPTDTTVNDFWRMIWEHGLELIVMLTNLEEYSKVKCSKYWPDDVRGSRNFGGLTVYHVQEKRYSDYIVRELKISKQPMNADGQPIVEGNGIAKRNGDCTEASEGSVPTSPRDVKDPETRIVKQYHFLMWKDFAAPEHAYSILKFIKRVNSAWSGMVGRACVVHCSAGVGRTGTLVALDCLLEQLRDVGHAAVFNTVAELRRSRNFLVQSLKQYVFVYRALVEYAHYGDTEIPAHRLKASVDRLRNTPPQATTCLMELEFEKILNSPIPEPIKSCAAGGADELRPKNRSVDILPYDRNRVILAPIPGRDYSTYINASFIEAYDNVEGFIITQDPMPSTIMDFWRMVSEHNVTTIVMLSEMGEGKCPRYWDDGTAQYEHISVQYEESESCPYYTRRQFRVVNNKSGCSSSVRQLQYQGWPTAPGHVPEVTRGLAELADAAAPPAAAAGAMLVHCQFGTERSALFVALCILITQLRTERRVDVCCVARKVRSQRVKTINTFLQYEFLHRAILNYAELHNLLEDS